jgi:hypothetical protein
VVPRRWCHIESQNVVYVVEHAELLVSPEEFRKNIVWKVVWRAGRGAYTRHEAWYGMSDGTIIHFYNDMYGPDDWCDEYPSDEGIRKLLERLERDIERYGPRHVEAKGDVPEEIASKIREWLGPPVRFLVGDP